MRERQELEEEFFLAQRELDKQEDQLMNMRYDARRETEDWIAWVEQFHRPETPLSERQASVRGLVESLDEFERFLTQKEIELDDYRQEQKKEYYRKLEDLESASEYR